MTTILQQGVYSLVFSKTDNEFQIYSTDEYLGGYDTEEKAREDFIKYCAKGELIENDNGN